MSYVLNDANSRKKQRRMELHLIIFRPAPLNVMNIGLAGGEEEEEEGDVIVQSTFTLEIRS